MVPVFWDNFPRLVPNIFLTRTVPILWFCYIVNTLIEIKWLFNPYILFLRGLKIFTIHLYYYYYTITKHIQPSKHMYNHINTPLDPLCILWPKNLPTSFVFSGELKEYLNGSTLTIHPLQTTPPPLPLNPFLLPLFSFTGAKNSPY